MTEATSQYQPDRETKSDLINLYNRLFEGEFLRYNEEAEEDARLLGVFRDHLIKIGIEFS